MEKSKRERLEAAGWHVGTADDFLELSPTESALVDLKLSLSDALRRARAKARLSQDALARRIGSSQSRVARMEAADPSVSLDLLIRALLGAGASQETIALAIAPMPVLRPDWRDAGSETRNSLVEDGRNTTSPVVTMATAESMINRSTEWDISTFQWRQPA